jgi:hypothetical protein
MAGKKRVHVREADVQGLKFFDKLAPLLVRLHEVGCERDKAGNRQLHFDQYCLLVLLFLFNPVVRSLRSIQQASQLRNVQRKLGCLRASLGSLSEAQQVFQPERLKEIIAELGAQLHPIARATNRLDLPAWIIALIYRYRWTIEVFFRFFKHVLDCRHLLSHDPVGIEIQTSITSRVWPRRTSCWPTWPSCRNTTPKPNRAALCARDRDGVRGCAELVLHHLDSALRPRSALSPSSPLAPAWHRAMATQ